MPRAIAPRSRGDAWRRMVGTASLAALTLAWGCGQEPAGGAGSTDQGSSGSAATPASGEALAKRGRSVYMSNCTACHAVDPSQDGALGPAVDGASHELLEARILRAEYPPGYTPKRASNLMIAMPHLEREIDALHAFLNPKD